jgi:DeoR/GlpR family transcriptional regulator of sugar metabolism
MRDKGTDGRATDGHQRRQRICELLLVEGYLDVAEISAQLDVKAATIRRDLERLETQGALRRVHGGAYAQATQMGVEMGFNLRKNFHMDAKRLIAQKAASALNDGDTIYIDSGTTALMVAEELVRRRSSVVVVTHSLAVVEVLQETPGIELHVVGGRYLAHARSMVGPVAEQTLRAFHLSKMILGISGIDYKNRALTMSPMEEVSIKRIAISQSERVILVADHTKFGKPSLISMIPLDDVHCIVTDASLPEEATAALNALKIELVVAQPDPAEPLSAPLSH